MKNKKILRYLIIGAVVLIIFAVIGKKQSWFGKSKAIKISTEKVSKRNIIETITANGKIQPETEVKISPDVSGEIVELNIMEGDEVEEGKLLLKIKPDIYLSNLDRMKASLNSTKSNLANSKARLVQTEAQFKQTELSFKRNKKLWAQKTISEAEWETAESSYLVAKAEVEAGRETVNAAEYAVKSSEASLKEAKENLTKTTIYAPMSGTISKLNVEKGERVVGTAQMAGTELLRIANLSKMEVKVEVNENDIVRVSLHDTAIIEIDAYLKEKFKGIVTEIANSANTVGVSTDQVTSFDVKILILPESYAHLIPEDNPNFYPFRPGMSANVDIQTRIDKNALSIPIQAVTTRKDKSQDTDSLKTIKNQTDDKMMEVVFVYDDGKVNLRKVVSGIQDNNYIKIDSGLKFEEEVVISPYNAISKKLKDGTAVEKVDKNELFTEKDKD